MLVHEAIIAKLSWKTPLMDSFAQALIEAAFRLRNSGIIYFNGDDVDEWAQPGDKTTVGTVFKLLLMENIIELWRGSIPELGIYGGIRRSSRPGNNGHRNQLYILTSVGIANAWLERHGRTVTREQLSLF